MRIRVFWISLDLVRFSFSPYLVRAGGILLNVSRALPKSAGVENPSLRLVRTDFEMSLSISSSFACSALDTVFLNSALLVVGI